MSAASVRPVRLRTRLRLLSTTALRGCRRGMPHCATSWTPCWSLCRRAGCATCGPFCFPVVPCLRGTGDGGGASAATERPCAVLAPGAAGAMPPRRLRAFARVSSAALSRLRRTRKGVRAVGAVGAALRQVDTRCLCARQIA